MRATRPALPLVLLLALAACSVRSEHALSLSSRPASEADAAAITELSRRFSAAYVAGDAEAMAALYTPDAVIFPGNSEAITGTEAIRQFWTLAPGHRVVRHVATPTEIRVDGDHAYDHGVYEVAGERNGEAYGPVPGKYVIVWRRTPQGWRMHLDMWNLRPRPAP
ncbi:MAG TPA: nuclear transport factor 2 family protein [Longimicrobium sp.]|nr:nuclear transport factor 2 family protein [Longimicrobium sp.]